MVISTLPGDALGDIQGLVLTGYGHLNEAAFMFLQVVDADRGRAWLREVLPSITSAAPWPTDPQTGLKIKPVSAVNIAMSFAGLTQLGLLKPALDSFPTEFVLGQAARPRVLGDTGPSAPENWEIGGPRNPPLHAVVLLYGQDAATRDGVLEQQRQIITRSQGGVVELSADTATRPPNQREHFGFSADGISQPILEGTEDPSTNPEWLVALGEFLLGYRNAYGMYPLSPAVPLDADPGRTLPVFPEGALPDQRDFGRNGTYLVYRRLGQDVAGFWQFIERTVDAEYPGEELDSKRFRMCQLAAKCMGRWPSGAPLVLSPDKDNPAVRDDNSFLYRPTDADGLACPLGAHIRRANPRDSIRRINDTPAESFATSNQHRIARRGMPYGSPLFPPEAIEEGLAPIGVVDDGKPRGLHFFALNADIQRQFEFVQQTWCNNSTFMGLSDETDPIIGDSDGSNALTIQRRPVRQRIENIPRFVSVKGGEYFFMPGLTALTFLSGL